MTMLRQTISCLLLFLLVAGHSFVKYTLDINGNFSFEGINAFNFHPYIKKSGI